MASKHRLTLSEVEDDEDLRERRARTRKARKKPPVKLSFLEDEDLEAPVMLHKKVKHVENKVNHVTEPENDDGKPIEGFGPILEHKNAIFADSDDMPTLVESDQLKLESLADSIPEVAAKCRVLVRTYEALELHHLFQTIEENCRFRLFLYAAAFGHTLFWPKDQVLTSVLRRLLTTSSVVSVLESNGIKVGDGAESMKDIMATEKKLTPTQAITLDSLEYLDFPIVKNCGAIDVPKRVSRLLPGE
ncbi:hypothetical protein HF325_005397 [Metschnikowia pulcherrima]|uniref:Uncharacterized protein n=1 Tax=Metschnikowia pulcherrima TaxID=27326 RepID=A0A8H7GNM0_9ASCO|nr:hypothetical protein HF325_005397 [Metschnikowia pulcherrima]